MHEAFSRVDHRPWSVPDAGWSWRQSWQDLLLAHWPIDTASLRPLVPSSLQLDEFDGTAWVGLVPFRITGVMKRPFPDLPGISAFPELKVRTYVTHRGKSGVWFFSLDVTNALAVWAARRFFYLPYFRARMTVREHGKTIVYSSSRPGAGFEGSYSPISSVYEAKRGSIEHWLTERYCLYAQAPNGTLYRNEVHHVPWPLQKAEARIDVNAMFATHGLDIVEPPALLHFARRLDVVVWPGERVA
jgi:uncharacterized protein YqjF (DUF2071 family)